MTAYSAMSCPSSCRQMVLRELPIFKPSSSDSHYAFRKACFRRPLCMNRRPRKSPRMAPMSEPVREVSFHEWTTRPAKRKLPQHANTAIQKAIRSTSIGLICAPWNSLSAWLALLRRNHTLRFDLRLSWFDDWRKLAISPTTPNAVLQPAARRGSLGSTSFGSPQTYRPPQSLVQDQENSDDTQWFTDEHHVAKSYGR